LWMVMVWFMLAEIPDAGSGAGCRRWFRQHWPVLLVFVLLVFVVPGLLGLWSAMNSTGWPAVIIEGIVGLLPNDRHATTPEMRGVGVAVAGAALFSIPAALALWLDHLVKSGEERIATVYLPEYIRSRDKYIEPEIIARIGDVLPDEIRDALIDSIADAVKEGMKAGATDWDELTSRRLGRAIHTTRLTPEE
jgi:hypothetical protein